MFTHVPPPRSFGISGDGQQQLLIHIVQILQESRSNLHIQVFRLGWFVPVLTYAAQTKSHTVHRSTRVRWSPERLTGRSSEIPEPSIREWHWLFSDHQRLPLDFFRPSMHSRLRKSFCGTRCVPSTMTTPGYLLTLNKLIKSVSGDSDLRFKEGEFGR